MSLLSAAAKNRVMRYGKTTKWLLHDAFPKYRHDVGLVVILFIASLALKLLAFVVLSQYIRVLSSPTEIDIPFFGQVPGGNSYELLAAASLGSLLCLVLSFAARYAGDVRLLRVAGHYEVACTKRAAKVIAMHGDHRHLDKWVVLFPKLVNTYPRYCALTTRLSVRFILPLLTAIVALAGLFVIDHVLTAILTILTGASAPFLYRISVRGARYSQMLEEQAKTAAAAKRDIVAQLASRARQDGVPLTDEVVSDVFAEAPLLHASVDSYIGRLKVTEESSLLTGVLMGVSIFAILLYKGLEILGAAHGWALLAVYFILLRVCLGSFMQSANIVTAINRLYPQVYRYSVFAATGARLERQGVPPTPVSKGWGGGVRKGAAIVEDEEDVDAL